jgi:hypothetical protein
MWWEGRELFSCSGQLERMPAGLPAGHRRYALGAASSFARVDSRGRLSPHNSKESKRGRSRKRLGPSFCKIKFSLVLVFASGYIAAPQGFAAPERLTAPQGLAAPEGFAAP